jgi:hypothetical protein
MKRQVFRIDENGFFVEPVILEATDSTPADCVETSWAYPFAFYKPKWDGHQWVEGGVAPELSPVDAFPSLEQQVEDLKQQLAVRDEVINFILLTMP